MIYDIYTAEWHLVAMPSHVLNGGVPSHVLTNGYSDPSGFMTWDWYSSYFLLQK